MSKKVVAVFSSRDKAERAVSDLRKMGFDKEISVIAKDDKGGDRRQGGMTMGGGDLTDGTTTGGVIGGLAGLAVGAGALVIPGLGPLVAAGPIAGLLSGAATGGIAGALVVWGIPEAEGKRYEEEVRQGKVLVTVEASDNKVMDAAGSLRKLGADEVKTH